MSIQTIDFDRRFATTTDGVRLDIKSLHDHAGQPVTVPQEAYSLIVMDEDGGEALVSIEHLRGDWANV